jgi:hypothetical protein
MPTHIENLSAELRSRRAQLTAEIKAIDAAIGALGTKAKGATKPKRQQQRAAPTKAGLAENIWTVLQKGPQSRPGLRKAVGNPSDKQLAAAIDQLVRDGSIERTGHARGTRYVLCAATR